MHVYCHLSEAYCKKVVTISGGNIGLLAFICMFVCLKKTCVCVSAMYPNPNTLIRKVKIMRWKQIPEVAHYYSINKSQLIDVCASASIFIQIDSS